MRSYHVSLGCGLEGITLREHPRPEPGRGEVVVQVRAVSLNYREIMIITQGRYPLPIKPDVIAVSDGAGEVVAVGEGVTRVSLGDRVAAAIFPNWIDGPFNLEVAPQLGGSRDGMLTEYALLDEAALVYIPSHLSFEEAATLPCAAVTAWNALTGGMPLLAGQVVLTLGSGGVSLFALQFAKMFGARVIATTSSDEKAVRLRALGADEVINHHLTPDWPEEVRRLTGGKGADHIVEVGGAASLEKSLRAAARGGEIAFIGTLGTGPTMLDANLLFGAGATIRPIAVGSRAQFQKMNQAIAVNRLKPVIDRTFGFDEVRGAFAYYASSGALGKVVIRVGEPAQSRRES